jgi:hypothetical protein
MGEIVIVAYKPKPGCEAELLQLTVEHIPFLRSLDLVTDRAAIAMRGKDGTIIEVFEWQEGAVDRAHTMPEIHKLWERYGKVCDYTPLQALPEAANLFAMFTPLNV